MCKCDSRVVETDVRFPTDISLLFDAVRKVDSPAKSAWCEVRSARERTFTNNCVHKSHQIGSNCNLCSPCFFKAILFAPESKLSN